MPTSSPEPSRTATVLLITDVPWIYKALREGLGLTKVETGASGVEYDTGTLDGRESLWRVCLPVDRLTSGAQLIQETSPTLVVFIGGELIEEAPTGYTHFACSPVIGVEENVVDIQLAVDIDMTEEVAEFVRRVDRAVVRGLLDDTSVEARRLAVPSRLWSAFDLNARRQSSRWVALEIRGHPTSFYALFDQFRSRIHEFFRVLLDLKIGAVAPKGRDPIVPMPVPSRPLISIYGTLASVELSSIRMFEQVRWATGVSRPGWHVVLGDNASGKTSFLRALALALLPRAERDALRQDWSSWLRLVTPRGHVGVSVVADSGASHTLSLSLERTSPGGSPAGGVVDVRTSETLQYNGFLAGYGPFRRFTGGDPEWLNSFRAHPRTQRVITLFEERAALSDALEWLKDLWVRAETVKPSPPEKPFLKQLLAFINTTDFLPTGVTLLEPNADGVWCQDANGRRVQVIELSDGYRAALSLALDLVRHLYVEHGAAKVFAGKKGKSLTIPAEGIVLIDEPDAHLHPTWQQRLGGWFKRCFPGMQFVVTTHSPIVCQAADSVLLLPNPGEEEPARMATPAELDRLRYGDVLDAFATDFFGRRVTRSQAGREKMDRLAALNLKAVQAGLDEAERAEQETLRAALGTAGEAPGAAS